MCEIEEIELSPGEIDGWEEQGPWDFDPFGPDADFWNDVAEELN